MNELTPEARELVERCPQLINRFAERVNALIDNWDPGDADHIEILEPVTLEHVAYDDEQLGREK